MIHREILQDSQTPQNIDPKGNNFFQRDKQEVAFQKLNEMLCNAPILSLPGGTNGFIMYRDASQQDWNVD